jgi:hypothetical protein
MSKARAALILPMLTAGVALALAATLYSHHGAARQAGSENAGTDVELLRRKIAIAPLDPALHLAVAMSGAASRSAPQEIERLALRSAAQLAPFDSNVHRAQAFRFFEAGDQRQALAKVRALSKIDPESHNDTLGALLQVAGGEAWIEHVNVLTEERSALLDAIAHSTCASNAKMALATWAATRAASVSRLQSRTLECLLGRVTSPGDAIDVYTLWIDSIKSKPSEIPFVFNGDFETPDSNGPFNWRIGAGGEYRDGYTARVQSERVSGKPNRFLQIDFNSRAIRSEMLSINLALPPGNYRLSYRTKDEVTADAATPELVLTCNRTNARLGDAPGKVATGRQSSNSGSWREVSRDFSVDSTCYLQRMVLTSASANWQARGFKGRLLIDDVVITLQ